MCVCVRERGREIECFWGPWRISTSPPADTTNVGEVEVRLTGVGRLRVCLILTFEDNAVAAWTPLKQAVQESFSPRPQPRCITPGQDRVFNT